MAIRSLLAAAGGAVVVGLVMSAALHADVTNPSKTTYLTFNRPVGLPGVALGTGTYIFELADPGNLTVVRVMDRDRKRVYYTGFTHEIRRPAGLPSDRMVSFGEAPAGAVQPITVWWPLDETTGRQFIYPKK